MSIICAECGGPVPQKRVRCCSSSCDTAHRRCLRLKTHEALGKICLNCSTPISYKNRANKFCGHACAASFTNRGREHSPETKAKQSVASKAVTAAWTEEFREGRRRLAMTTIGKRTRIEHPCPQCGKSILGPRVSCSIQCYKEGAQRRALDAIGTGRGRRGRYQGIDCQSSYELAFVIWHLDRGYKIERSTLSITYRYGDRWRKYRPDFSIGEVTYEIKGYMDKLSKAKFKAIRKTGIAFELILATDINPYLDYVCLRYGKTRETIHELYDIGPGSAIRTRAA